MSYRELDQENIVLQKQLDNVQERIESEDETTKLQAKEKYLYWKLYQINRKEEENWQIKSISLFIQASDKNTTFFHNKGKFRRNKN